MKSEQNFQSLKLAVIGGIMRNNKKELSSIMLAKGKIDLSNQEEWDGLIYQHLDQKAASVVTSLISLLHGEFTDFSVKRKVEYATMMQIITDALVRGNQPELISLLLAKGQINLFEKEDWVRSINSYVNQTSHAILSRIKETMGDALTVMDGDEEIESL